MDETKDSILSSSDDMTITFNRIKEMQPIIEKDDLDAFMKLRSEGVAFFYGYYIVIHAGLWPNLINCNSTKIMEYCFNNVEEYIPNSNIWVMILETFLKEKKMDEYYRMFESDRCGHIQISSEYYYNIGFVFQIAVENDDMKAFEKFLEFILAENERKRNSETVLTEEQKELVPITRMFCYAIEKSIRFPDRRRFFEKIVTTSGFDILHYSDQIFLWSVQNLDDPSFLKQLLSNEDLVKKSRKSLYSHQIMEAFKNKYRYSLVPFCLKDKVKFREPGYLINIQTGKSCSLEKLGDKDSILPGLPHPEIVKMIIANQNLLHSRFSPVDFRNLRAYLQNNTYFSKR